MKRQKRVAVINDVTGFGRCSAAVAQPIISAMKIQCCVMPTAILSVHTGFPNYFLQDYTPYLRTYDVRVEGHDRDALLLAECVDFVAHERIRERHERETVDVLGRH